MAEQIEMELTFKGESADEMKSILAEAGADKVEVRPARGLVSLETVMLGFLLAEEAATLISKLVRSWKCGVVVVVDANGKKVSTEKNCDLPRGSALLVRPDGTQVTLQNPTEPEIGSWFKDAFKAVTGKG